MRKRYAAICSSLQRQTKKFPEQGVDTDAALIQLAACRSMPDLEEVYAPLKCPKMGTTLAERARVAGFGPLTAAILSGRRADVSVVAVASQAGPVGIQHLLAEAVANDVETSNIISACYTRYAELTAKKVRF